MGLERKAQDANNNGYPLTAYGVVGEYERSAKGSMVAGDAEKGTYQARHVFDLADLPSSFTSEGNDVLTLPSGAYIEAATVRVDETISGGTSLNVGISQPDGTVTDADGLVAGDTSTTGTIVGAGALVGTDLANDGQVTVGGDRTAGVIELVIDYRV